MRLLANSEYLIRGGCLNFQAVEGTAPYTFSIVSGGGSIDPVSGLYQAGNTIETVVIQVEDATLEVETYTLAVLGHLELFCMVIREELNLTDEQVYIYNQKYMIPKDHRLYIAVGVGAVVPIGVYNKGGEQHGNFRGSYEINLISKGRDALDRKEEVLLALSSDRARRVQALNGFYIAPLSSQFNNLSETEGVSQLFRFNITVNIQYAIAKVNLPDSYDYYDTFNDVEILTNK